MLAMEAERFGGPQVLNDWRQALLPKRAVVRVSRNSGVEMGFGVDLVHYRPPNPPRSPNPPR